MLAVSDEFLYVDHGDDENDPVPIPWKDVVRVDIDYIGKGALYSIDLQYLNYRKGCIWLFRQEADKETTGALRKRIRKLGFRRFQMYRYKTERTYFRPGKYRTSSDSLYYYVEHDQSYWHLCYMGYLIRDNFREQFNAPEDPDAAIIIS